MYSGLVHTHSGLRWLLLIALIYAIFNAFSKRGQAFTDGDKKINLFALILTHVQVLIGLGLYFISPKSKMVQDVMKNPVSRFFAVEHISVMIIAAILITIGYSKSKKGGDKAFKTTLIFYILGLVLMLSMIPWNTVKYGSNWF